MISRQRSTHSLQIAIAGVGPHTIWSTSVRGFPQNEQVTSTGAADLSASVLILFFQPAVMHRGYRPRLLVCRRQGSDDATAAIGYGEAEAAASTPAPNAPTVPSFAPAGGVAAPRARRVIAGGDS